MIKRIFLSCLICFSLISCAELQSIAENYPQQGFGLSQQQIANGLKQALDKGIDDQVSKLTQTNGFYKNQLVKYLSISKELPLYIKFLLIFFYENVV